MCHATSCTFEDSTYLNHAKWILSRYAISDIYMSLPLYFEDVLPLPKLVVYVLRVTHTWCFECKILKILPSPLFPYPHELSCISHTLHLFGC